MLLLNFKKNSGSNQCWNLAIFILPIKPAAHYVTSTSSNEEWSFGWNGCLRKEARTNESTNEKNPNSQALGLNPVYKHHLHIHRSFCRGRWYTLALWRRGSHCVDHCLSPSSSLPVFSPLLAHSNTMVRLPFFWIFSCCSSWYRFGTFKRLQSQCAAQAPLMRIWLPFKLEIWV